MSPISGIGLAGGMTGTKKELLKNYRFRADVLWLSCATVPADLCTGALTAATATALVLPFFRAVTVVADLRELFTLLFTARAAGVETSR